LPSAKVDLLETIDWVFPRGLDHHEMFAGVPVVEDVMAKVARKLAGLGELPDRVAPAGPPAEVRSVDVAIVGGGAAGLACAEALAGSGLTVEVVEEQPKVGGRALLGLESARDPDWARAAAERCLSAGIRVTTGATVLGVYRDEGVRVLPLLRRGDDRLQKLVCRSLVLANGSSEPMTPFTGNDLPGVYAGRGLARMLLQQRVTPGGQAVVVGSTDETLGLAHLLRASGVEVEALVDPAARLSSGDFRVLSGHSPSRCRGISAVRGLVVTDGAGRRERLKCDVVALCDLPAPAFELGRQAGAHVAFDAAKGGFALQAEDGRTAAPGVFAAGDVTGVGSVARAREQGAAVGRLLARTAGASA
ncbi:MAG: FAD-dependent oxidoreductase, partial [Myxococcales bacterium]